MEGTRQGPGTGSYAPGEAPAKVKRTNPARKLAIIALAVVAVLVLALFLANWLAYSFSHETTDDAQIDSDQVQITSKIAERVDALRTDTNQRVHVGQTIVQLDDVDERARFAQAQASVQAQASTARAAQENVSLTRDTQNAQNLENTGSIAGAVAGIDSARAQAQSARRQIDAAAAAVASSEADLRVAEAAVPGRTEDLRRALADLRRVTSLVSTGDVAQTQLDADRASYASARSNLAQAQADVTAARANVDQAEQRLDAQRYATNSTAAQIGVQQAQLTTAQGKYAESSAPSRVRTQQANANASKSQIDALDAQLLTAKVNLGYTHVVSPVNGYVGEKDVEVGQFVAPGQALFTIIPATGVYVTANYKETQIGHMRVGDPVDIAIDAYSGVKFHGRVSDLSPASENKFSLVPAQNATGNFVKVTQRLPVRIAFDRDTASDYPLRPGLSVETSVRVSH